MPRREDIKRVLVIGSGPIVIGQAAEFDYAGTQACRSLKEEGVEVVLVNSNPATIMTDRSMADSIYIEPLVVPVIENIIKKEKPDSLLPTLGGQTGLNLAMELHEKGILDKYNVKLLGTPTETIKMAEDRKEFKDTMAKIGEPCIISAIVTKTEEALNFADETGYPVVVRPAYTLGGTGGGIAYDKNELKHICSNGLKLSRVGQALIEKCISGWKEIEYEVVRDGKGNVVTICSMENLDPVGIHTGDSIVVAPAQTLTKDILQMFHKANMNIIHTLGIEGGCNIQYALRPDTNEYAVIEVNPRVSRSSALASKATGYPIAKVSAKIAIGFTLDEIKNKITGEVYGPVEPVVDYYVLKIPKWPFDKFVTAERSLGTQMKATGEVMSIALTFESALLKAIRSLELGFFTIEQEFATRLTTEEVRIRLSLINDERLFIMAEAIRRGVSIDDIYSITKVNPWFLEKIKNIVDEEQALKKLKLSDIDKEKLYYLKDFGFTDKTIADFTKSKVEDVKKKRDEFGIHAVFRSVDTPATRTKTVSPYYYSIYDKKFENSYKGETDGTNELFPNDASANKKKVLVIGSGPIRIGQGIEFDYCSVHAVWSLKKIGYEAIIINNNPETVSTDYDTANRLYFEPLTIEDVMNVIDLEKPDGVIVQFGGQTAIKLAKQLDDRGIKIFGSQLESIDTSEDREKFDKILERLNIPRPIGKTIFTFEEAKSAANTLGYPVLVRPSYVLGGQGMEIAYNDTDIKDITDVILRNTQEYPILIDKYLHGLEIEVDAICDGKDILIPGIMEHIERAGIHSGDSMAVYPPPSIDSDLKATIIAYTRSLALSLDVVGLVNIQYVYFENTLYVIEVNPRSSRTVPYISKVTNIPMIEIATRIMFGAKLSDFPYGTGLYKEGEYFAIKAPVFSFQKLRDVEISVGPEMKSTGESLGVSKNYFEALYKAVISSNILLPTKDKGILFSVRDSDKPKVLWLAEFFTLRGYKIYATLDTAAYISQYDLKVEALSASLDEHPNIYSVMEDDKIGFVINVPTRGRDSHKNGFLVRRKAVELGIPCLTSLDTAYTLIECMRSGRNIESMDLVDIKTITQ